MTKCEDVISRQEVLKQLKGCLLGGETEYQYVKLHIDSIPSVEPQTKTGHWIEMGQNKDKTHNVICSECKVGFKFRLLFQSRNFAPLGFRRHKFRFQQGSYIEIFLEFYRVFRFRLPKDL